MATIASLDVILSANTARFRQDLNTAVAASRTFVNRAGTTFRRLNRTIFNLRNNFLGFVAALGVGQILRTTDDLLDLSRATGLTFEEFQRLAFVFDQAGINNQRFARGLATLAQRINDLEEGTSTAVIAFGRLQLSFDDLAGLTQEDQLRLLLERLRGVDDATQRAAIAADLFGTRLSTALGPILDETQESVDALAASFQGVISEEDARVIDQFNDIIQELGFAVRRLVTQFAPLFAATGAFLAFVTDLITNLPILNNIISTGIAVAIGVTLVAALRTGLVAVTNMARSLVFATAAMGTMQTASFRTARAITAVTATFIPMATAVRVGSTALTLMRAPLLAVTGLFAGLRLALRALLGPIGLVILAVEVLVRFWDDIVRLTRQATNSVIGFFNSLIEGFNSFFETQIDFIPMWEENVNAPIEETTNETLPALFDGLEDGLGDLEEPLSSFQQTLMDAMDTVAEISSLGSRAFDRLADSLTDFVTTGRFQIRDFAQFVIREFIRIQIRSALANSFSLFGGFRQQGGPVNAGQSYIVGEAGPELFVPNVNGNIVPNNELGASEGQTNVTYNIQAVDARSFQQLAARDPEFIFNLSERGRRRQGRF